MHTPGLLHRDLKPANILLGPNGPKIIELGLAAFVEPNVSLTVPNEAVGTPGCMAPERAADVNPLTPGVEVYALGAVLLFAETGHYPHEAATPYMVFRLVTDPATAPHVFRGARRAGAAPDRHARPQRRRPAFAGRRGAAVPGGRRGPGYEDRPGSSAAHRAHGDAPPTYTRLPDDGPAHLYGVRQTLLRRQAGAGLESLADDVSEDALRCDLVTGAIATARRAGLLRDVR
ncbi:hypothetical protein [Streptomyces sp. NPDC001292]|uniref:protein kinase domain-containing protein n=1 Tax=Streptomyces sp. NPDC001292 TaxID=3364558 RepID=UPI003688D5C5